MKFSDSGNKYFQEKEPWKNNDKETLFVCINMCKDLALLLQPFIPNSSDKILKLLNCDERNFEDLNKFNLKGEINKPYIIFNKLEDKDIEQLKNVTSKFNKFFED
ncbi:hypothetical protein J4214_05925 [Candidatus Woesearchaeota archaeon]|nr:hypothetical protein [Candidatus Woesearchaeota archaeon]